MNYIKKIERKQKSSFHNNNTKKENYYLLYYLHINCYILKPMTLRTHQLYTSVFNVYYKRFFVSRKHIKITK